jgi:hypothetical protein
MEIGMDCQKIEATCFICENSRIALSGTAGVTLVDIRSYAVAHDWSFPGNKSKACCPECFRSISAGRKKPRHSGAFIENDIPNDLEVGRLIMTARLHNICKMENIGTAGELRRRFLETKKDEPNPYMDLYRTPNCGAKTIKEVEELLFRSANA